MFKIVQQFPKTSERFQMLPSASERVPTHPGRSEQVQTRLRTYENFEKLGKNFAKTWRKLRRSFANVACVPSLFCLEVSTILLHGHLVMTRWTQSMCLNRHGPCLMASRKRFGCVYFVSVDYNSITGLTTESFSQKFSICAAVAAAAGALWAAGLGTAAPEGPRGGGDGRTN